MNVSTNGTLERPPAEAPPAESAPAPTPAAELPLTVLEPRSGWQVIDVGELWRYRELLFFLAWRDVKVRYKQTVLGAAWAVIQPLATMIVFTFFLGKMAGAASDLEAYPLFLLAGLVPWSFFSNAIGSAGQSVVGNQNLITKVYFPRLIIPLGAVGAGVVDFAIAFALLALMMVGYLVAPGWGALLLPVIVLFLMLAALGTGTLLSALTVAYRDFRHVVPFLMQLWMFATPAIYVQSGPAADSWSRWLLPLNPAYGLIATFRQALLNEPLDWYALGVSAAVSVALLAFGCAYFRRVERKFADVI
jgi:lipopolysaccharide transport system permease protein